MLVLNPISSEEEISPLRRNLKIWPGIGPLELSTQGEIVATWIMFPNVEKSPNA